MKNTEAWWVCSKCKQPIVKTKSKGVKEVMTEHCKACPLAGFWIRQVEQRKRGREV